LGGPNGAATFPYIAEPSQESVQAVEVTFHTFLIPAPS